MIKTHGLTLIALNVRDPDNSLQFYGKVFGVVEVYRSKGFLHAQTPGTRDIIVFQKGEKNLGKSGGIEHFGFRMVSDKDLDLAIQTIERAGGKILKSGEFVPGEPYLSFRDPDGYEVEVAFELPTPIDASDEAEGVVRRFVERINAHDTAGLVVLLSPDHVFVDALGNHLTGVEKMQPAWESFFDSFPEYHISVSDLVSSGTRVSLAGEASGRWRVDGGIIRDKSWKVPAAWWALVRGAQIQEWRVYCDTSWTRPPIE